MRLGFSHRLEERARAVGAPSCVGIDPHLGRVPGTSRGTDPATNAEAVRAFALSAIDAMADHIAAIKPQSAFFEALGAPGVAVLAEVVAHAQSAGLLVLLDAKRGDIGSTAEAYAQATLDDDGPMGADAVTLSPYLGPESLTPFMARADAGKGLFVLVRTSNPGAAGWQRDLGLADAVAHWVTGRAHCVGAVIGATLPADEICAWRDRLPDTWLLAPGVGAQGAGVDELRAFFPDDRPVRALPTASRSVLFPDLAQLAERSQRFRDLIRAAGGAC